MSETKGQHKDRRKEIKHDEKQRERERERRREERGSNTIKHNTPYLYVCTTPNVLISRSFKELSRELERTYSPSGATATEVTCPV